MALFSWSVVFVQRVFIFFPATIFSYIFLDNDCLKLPAGRGHQSVVRQRFPTEENVKHKRKALEAEKVISGIVLAVESWPHAESQGDAPVRRNLDLELGRFLLPIYYRAVRIRCLCHSVLELDL